MNDKKISNRKVLNPIEKLTNIWDKEILFMILNKINFDSENLVVDIIKFDKQRLVNTKEFEKIIKIFFSKLPI